MMAKSPMVFLLLLGALTFLGAVIGYCVAAISERQRAREAIKSVQLAMQQQQRAATLDLVAARQSIKRLHAASGSRHVSQSSSSALTTAKNTASQARNQSALIKALEEQLAIAEQERRNLQRETHQLRQKVSAQTVANGKVSVQPRKGSSALPAVKRAAHAGISQSPSNEPPLLSRRVPSASQGRNSAGSANTPVDSSQKVQANSGNRMVNMSLNGELEIPTLSESELAEPELELSEVSARESGKRG